MNTFYEVITQENHDKIKKITPYIIGISLIMFVVTMMPVENISSSEINTRISHGIFAIIVIAFHFAFKYLRPSNKLIYVFVGSFFIWGFSRMLILPEELFSSTPLISILFCTSFFIIFKLRDAIILYGLTVIMLSIGFLVTPETNFIVYSVSYGNIIILCGILIYFNKKNRKELYEKTKKLTISEKRLESDIEKKLIENLFLISQFESILEYGNYISEDAYNSENDFLKDIFKKSFEMCEFSHFASLYTIKNNRLKFILTIGHDTGSLNKIVKNKKVANECLEDVRIIKNTNKKHIKNIQEKNFVDVYFNAVKNVQESLVFQVKVSDTKIVGMCLDIKDGSEQSFAQNNVRFLKAFQTMIKFYYINDNYNSLQMRFKNDIIYSLINFLEIHDEYTKGHSTKVANYSKSIAEKMNFSEKKIEEIYWAGLLHDIGKLLIPANILNKATKLTDEEFLMIKKHPQIAAKALSENNELKEISNIILFHHENYDGSGYPTGIKKEEIPIESRILAVADSYEAMTSFRPYKRTKTKEEAVDELIRCSRAQFDPDVVTAFLNIMELK